MRCRNRSNACGSARSRPGLPTWTALLTAGFRADQPVFKDFSSVSSRHSVVPATWTNEDDVFDRPSTNILEELVAFLDENARGSMVVIDSITDLAVSDIVEIKDLVTTIKGLQRVAKRWNGLVYLMLTRGTLDARATSCSRASTASMRCLGAACRPDTSSRSSVRSGPGRRRSRSSS